MISTLLLRFERVHSNSITECYPSCRALSRRKRTLPAFGSRRNLLVHYWGKMILEESTHKYCVGLGSWRYTVPCLISPSGWVKSRHFATLPLVSPQKWRLRNDFRNSILMTCHYPDLGRVSDWSCPEGNLLQPIRSTTQIWVVTRHQYGISAHVPGTLFSGETWSGIAKCRLFSQATVP